MNGMKRFFGTHRDEDYGQVRYLTAKCSRLAQEKAVLEREYLVAGERERSLRNDLEGLSHQLQQQEQLNVELRLTHEQLLSQSHHEKELVEFLQQQLRRTVEEGSRDTGLLGLQLEQLCTELQLLQGSEAQLEGLVEELQRENLARATQVDILNAQLDSGMKELEALRISHQEAVVELEGLRTSHQETFLELEALQSSRQDAVMELKTLQTSHQQMVLELERVQTSHQDTLLELDMLQTSHQETLQELEALQSSCRENALELKKVQSSHQEPVTKLEALQTCQQPVMELEALQATHQVMVPELGKVETLHQETVMELEALQSSHQVTLLELKTLQSYYLQTALELEALQTSHQDTVEELELQQKSHHETLMELEKVQTSHRGTVSELEALRSSHQETMLELEGLRSSHEVTVQELRRENQGSLRKLQETAEQFEWLCDQQRNWMCYVKRFKDSMSEEKVSLLEQMGRMEKELLSLRKKSMEEAQSKETSSAAPETVAQHRGLSTWDDITVDLQTEVNKWRRLYEDLYVKLLQHQEENAVNGFRKPP
ncbi:hypothetical protein AGOR_G00182950 [Albula goreensis]|uniref:Uncharacterized protein n=1 Tax=Albula goreensis TaxID=1534307 RepID=A0A8T3CV81_9TELE|nr:hypothetical protein AGOR_G00182950 [Albula goreensis]